MKQTLSVLGALLLVCSSASGETFSLTGYVAGRGAYATGPRSWIEGGFGRLGERGSAASARAQIGGDWEPSPHFDVHVDGIARTEPSGDRGKSGGLVQAYAEGRIYSSANQLQLRAGQFFLPTSRENTGPLWTSPYMLSFSALNSWIGEELRPVGADLEWKHFAGERTFSAGATAFRDNDTLGAMLAWRGWAIGDRLTVFKEVLPLPPLPALSQSFIKQRSDGTVPFESDLDGRTGFAWRVRWNDPDVMTAQLTHLDNRGDRREYRGEYSWATDVNIASLQAGSPQSTLVASEYAFGKTGMGVAPVFVQADFYAIYLLASHKFGRHRISARYDLFATLDRDGSTAGDSTQHGRSIALAWLFDLTPHLRAGAEVIDVHSRNTAAVESGFPEKTGGRSVAMELRYTLR
jgi:hypothetical protein